MIGWPQLLVILVIALIFFGPKRIPDIANSLGRSINEFKKGKNSGADDDKKLEGDGDNSLPNQESPDNSKSSEG